MEDDGSYLQRIIHGTYSFHAFNGPSARDPGLVALSNHVTPAKVDNFATDIDKMWHGLLFCLWNIDTRPDVQVDLFHRLADIGVSDEKVASAYFDSFTRTMEENWSRVGHTMQFRMLVRVFLRQVVTYVDKQDKHRIINRLEELVGLYEASPDPVSEQVDVTSNLQRKRGRDRTYEYTPNTPKRQHLAGTHEATAGVELDLEELDLIELDELLAEPEAKRHRMDWAAQLLDFDFLPVQVAPLTGGRSELSSTTSQRTTRVTFRLEKNVYCEFEGLIPDAKTRTPPSCKPRGSALKVNKPLSKSHRQPGNNTGARTA